MGNLMSDKLTRLNPDDTDAVFEDVEVDLPATKPPDGAKITIAEAKRVAKQAGLVGVDARKMAGLAQFGKYLEEIGAEKIGGVYIAFTGEQIRSALEKVDLIGDDAPTDPELQMRANELKKELLKLMLEAGKTMLKVGEPSGPRQGPNPMAIPFPPNVAVQINNGPAQQTEVKVS